MKYGMRERISGAVILIALAVIFVPMLFDEPAPRDERPEPMLTIEQPVPVERRDVPDPEPPASLGEIAPPTAPENDDVAEAGVAGEGGETPPVAQPAPAEDAPVVDVPQDVPLVEEEASGEAAPSSPSEDPIAELARAATQRAERAAETSAPAQSAAAGEWAVQVGSFGEPANAERLEAQLKEQGYAAYRRQRDNDLTTVYVGPFASSEEGERVMGELKEAVNLQGLLVRVKE
ncbi:acetyl-CoA carboxylase subunit beta [Billgrantia azerbaijanica]|nr:acetyl-CoA carboxylase subunit beta [Halomonas azerbaijanica]